MNIIEWIKNIWKLCKGTGNYRNNGKIIMGGNINKSNLPKNPAIITDPDKKSELLERAEKNNNEFEWE